MSSLKLQVLYQNSKVYCKILQHNKIEIKRIFFFFFLSKPLSLKVKGEFTGSMRGTHKPKSGQSQLDLVTSKRSLMSVQNCASLNQRARATLRGIPQGSRSALRLGKHQTYREKNHPPLLEIEEKKEANLIA